MPNDQRLEHILAARLQGGKRASLVLFHQPAVTDHIGGQYRSKATLH